METTCCAITTFIHSHKKCVMVVNLLCYMCVTEKQKITEPFFNLSSLPMISTGTTRLQEKTQAASHSSCISAAAVDPMCRNALKPKRYWIFDTFLIVAIFEAQHKA